MKPGWFRVSLTFFCLTLLILTACGDQSALVMVTPEVSPSPSPLATQTPAPPKPDFNTIKTQLEAAWKNYALRYIQNDGRVIDPSGGDVTTSEGQSYALLRAVWQNDRPTFDRTFKWTQTNLQVRKTDKLFAYKWGKAPDGSWQVLDDAVATDADSDIALALVFAGKLWNDDSYNQAALPILNSLWSQTVVIVKSRPYLTAGDWAPRQATISLNPSYLSPYAYRIFANFDKAHNWAGLIDTSYEVIQGCSEANLASLTSAKLPPNWCGLDPSTGQFTTPQEYPHMNVDYGYDAFRVYWRVALDYKWFGEKRALDYLKWSDTLRLKWKQDGKLSNTYDHSGKPTTTNEALSNYVGALANFQFTEPALADSLVLEKFLPAYQTIANAPGGSQTAEFVGWGDPQDYYNQNWVWFGLAFYSGQLPNLAS